MNKIRIGIAVVLVWVLAFAPTAVLAQDNSAREKERAEIEELMWRYTRALDTGDGTTYAATYTVDGQFGAGANATKGTEALKKMVDALKPQPGAPAESRAFKTASKEALQLQRAIQQLRRGLFQVHGLNEF